MPDATKKEDVSEQVRSEMFSNYLRCLVLIREMQYDQFGGFRKKKKLLDEFQSLLVVLYIDLLPKLDSDVTGKLDLIEKIISGEKVKLTFEQSLALFIVLRKAVYAVTQKV